VRTLALLAALVLALAVQTTLAHLLLGNQARIDLVLVVVVYAALTGGPVSGLLVGSVAGLAQDALSGGVVGVSGLSKSAIGFLVGQLATHFIVAQALPRLVIFFGASVAHAALFFAVYQLIAPGRIDISWPAVLLQSALHAFIGLAAFRVIEGTPEWRHRRRLRRSSLRAR
jgi:rod shape-determining protein MreD